LLLDSTERPPTPDLLLESILLLFEPPPTLIKEEILSVPLKIPANLVFLS